MDDEYLIEAFLEASRASRDECPMLGLDRITEWPLRGRLAIQLARQSPMLELEKQRIHIDIEYGQVSSHEIHKVPGDCRVDLIVHERGSQKSNRLAAELKVKDARARKIDSDDDRKLRKLTTTCKFQVGIWIRLPQTSSGHRGRFAIYKNGKPSQLHDL
jgi:hypothetical protein